MRIVLLQHRLECLVKQHNSCHHGSTRSVSEEHRPESYSQSIVPDGSTTNTPLAPSVEKAYYRKCIELKRRLNDVEAANDEAKVRRVRLDRAIQKMRLERAFLLEQLALRMESDYEGSDGSADEQVNTVCHDCECQSGRWLADWQSASARPSSSRQTT